MIPLTSKECESYLNRANCHICKKIFEINTPPKEIIVKLQTIVIIQLKPDVLHIVCVI